MAEGRPARAGRHARAIPGAGYLLVVLVVVFAIFGSGFATTSNVLNIGVQSSVLLLLSLPMTLIIMSEGLDLSMGAVLSLSGVVLAMLLSAGRSLPLALTAALGVGLAFGVGNGLLVAVLGIPPFVATLGTLGIAQGIALVLTDGQSVVGIGDRLPALYNSTVAGLPFSVLAAALAYVALHVVLYHTRFGTYASALGGNREALVLAGVPATWYHVAIYGLGGLMAGFAALLLTGRMNAGHPVAAIGMEFDAIAAVIVGGTSFERGRGTLVGTLVGVCTVGVLKNGLNVLSVPSSLQVASIGLLVIVALAIESIVAMVAAIAGRVRSQA
jgi:ribose transport system permease protein